MGPLGKVKSFVARPILAWSGLAHQLFILDHGVMVDDDDDEIDDQELFDTSKSKITYSRSRDATRVTAVILDPAGISELKLYILLVSECEKLERRLGISEPIDEKH